MNETLSSQELSILITRVFQPRPTEHSIAFLVDLPDAVVGDSEVWAQRRQLAIEWASSLHKLSVDKSSVDEASGFPLQVNLVFYRNAHTNNGDLPPTAWVVSPDLDSQAIPPNAEAMEGQPAVPFEKVFAENPMIVAPTEFSATAPLKIAARTYPFRAATMPGFTAAMIPALKLDYEEINRRVLRLKQLVDDASSATCRFLVDNRVQRELRLDLRHRTAHASGGRFPDLGVAGNLPSGECYVVPYEGELEGDPSQTEGFLPVELEGHVVTYRIAANKAVEIFETEDCNTARTEAQKIAEEPAYANLAELGLGVLDAFGVEPTGEILLDEKLGLHIAFGRSDHFGGSVGPRDFSSPDAVVHIDRVYVPRIQPRVHVLDVVLTTSTGQKLALMENGRYVIDF